MAKSINEYFAPIEDIRPTETGASALERAGYRVGRSYQEVARNIEAEGRGRAGQIKAGIWPADIGKLEAASEKTKGSGGFRFRVAGGIDTGLADTDARPSHRGHAQISRGAGTLGNALSDGGYTMGSRSPSQETDYVNDQDLVDYTNVNKAQAAAAAFNGIGVGYGLDSKGQSVFQASKLNTADTALADYWSRYYGGGIPTTNGGYDQYGNPTTATNADTTDTSNTFTKGTQKGLVAETIDALTSYVDTTGGNSPSPADVSSAYSSGF